jgi:hypothetical protein
MILKLLILDALLGDPHESGSWDFAMIKIFLTCALLSFPICWILSLCFWTWEKVHEAVKARSKPSKKCEL